MAFLDEFYSTGRLPLRRDGRATQALRLATDCSAGADATAVFTDACRCYLPDADVARVVASRPRLAWQRAAAVLRHEIDSRQRGCNVSHWVRSEPFVDEGLGKILTHHVMLDLQPIWLASDENWRTPAVQSVWSVGDVLRPAAPPGRPGALVGTAQDSALSWWTRADRSMACEGWYSCYWKPLRASRCTARAIGALSKSADGGGLGNGGARNLKAGRAAGRSLVALPAEEEPVGQGKLEALEAHTVPPAKPLLLPFLMRNASAFERSWGPFLMHVALLDAWWRPARLFRRKLAAAVARIVGDHGGHGGAVTLASNATTSARLSTAGGCLALHVRRGDACRTSWRRCPELSAYLEPARAMARRYGLKTLFVSTDDEAVVASLHANASAEPWERVQWQRGVNRSGYSPPANCSGHGCWVEERLAAGEHAAAEKHATAASSPGGRRPLGTPLGDAFPVLEVLADVEAAARCDALVGSFDASISVLMLSRMVARLGAIPPFYSVGAYLCDHMNSDAGAPFGSSCPQLTKHPVPPPPALERCMQQAEA